MHHLAWPPDGVTVSPCHHVTMSPVDEAFPPTVLGSVAFNVVLRLQCHPPAILLLQLQLSLAQRSSATFGSKRHRERRRGGLIVVQTMS